MFMAKWKLAVIALTVTALVCVCAIAPLQRSEGEPPRNGPAESALAQTYTDHAAIFIDGNADLIAQALAESWQGDGSSGNPIVITGYRIDDTSVAGVRVFNVDLHWVLNGCLIEGGPPFARGIWLSNASNGVISNNVIRNRDLGIDAVDLTRNCSIISNEIYNNDQQGIVSLNGMSNCVISGNTFYGQGGNNIWMTGGFNDSEISDNILTGGGNGIRVTACLRSAVRNNTVVNSGVDAISMPSASDTVIADNNITGSLASGVLTNGDGLEIEDNTVSNCATYGIYLASGDCGSIRSNCIINSTNYGLKLGGSTANTTVTQNIFLDNCDSCQVEDNGEHNMFSYNHFNEWTSPDAESDNVVDSPYVLAGDAENSDPCPLVDPESPIPSTTTSSGAATNTGQDLDFFPYLAVGLMVVFLGVAGFLKNRR
jgi:parallel beta-helix repeat protein